MENPKNLTFTEVEAATIPSIASEVDLAVINSNYALGAGLNPVEDALALESSDSPLCERAGLQRGQREQRRHSGSGRGPALRRREELHRRKL